MANKKILGKLLSKEKGELLVEVNKLLEVLLDEDPKLRAARKQAHELEKSDNGIAEKSVQIYRQRLQE